MSNLISIQDFVDRVLAAPPSGSSILPIPILRRPSPQGTHTRCISRENLLEEEPSSSSSPPCNEHISSMLDRDEIESSPNYEVQFSEYSSMHVFEPTPLYLKGTLFYTRDEIKHFKRESEQEGLRIKQLVSSLTPDGSGSGFKSLKQVSIVSLWLVHYFDFSCIII